MCLTSIVSFYFSGGEQSHDVGAESSGYTIEGLQPDEALVFGVAAIINDRVGEAVTLASRTNPHSGTVYGLRVVDITPQRIRIEWLPTLRATGYKISWRNDVDG